LNVAVESPERIAHLADEAIMECWIVLTV
jgi:hypothetical protein